MRISEKNHNGGLTFTLKTVERKEESGSFGSLALRSQNLAGKLIGRQIWKSRHIEVFVSFVPLRDRQVKQWGDLILTVKVMNWLFIFRDGMLI